MAARRRDVATSATFPTIKAQPPSLSRLSWLPPALLHRRGDSIERSDVGHARHGHVRIAERTVVMVTRVLLHRLAPLIAALRGVLLHKPRVCVRLPTTEAGALGHGHPSSCFERGTCERSEALRGVLLHKPRVCASLPRTEAGCSLFYSIPKYSLVLALRKGVLVHCTKRVLWPPPLFLF